jgi:drug/metabolite transporter (DMT)-like permease
LRGLTSSIDAWTANGIRYPLSALLYFPVLYFSYRSGRLNFELIKRCAVPAAFAFGGQIFWALAHYDLQASEVGFLVRLSMVWALVGSMVLFADERVLLRKPWFYVGMTLLICGYVTFSLPIGGDSPGVSAKGFMLVFACAGFFGIYMVSVRRYIPNVDPILAFGIVSSIVSVGTIAGMFAFGEPSVIARQTTQSWTMLVGSSVLGIGLGHIWMYTSIQRLGATITSSCQSLMPFVTAMVASLALGEALSQRQWIGGVLIIVGVGALLSIRHVITDPT